jgi:pimeloyl-ACP methyl ester carboxylesterase
VRAVLTVIALVAATLVGAGAAPAQAAPGDAKARPVTPVRWSACTDSFSGFDCATYEVPLDHDRPRGATTHIAMVRRPADDPSRKIGSIFLNPGGPGAEGRSLVLGATVLFTPEVLARFDVVGFDPRGIGASDPVQCFPDDAKAEALIEQMRAVPLTADEIDSTLRANYAYTEACTRNVGPLLGHMSTLDVAEDLDLMRQGVGDDQLNFVGFSYGTLIGATYANLFPKRVRAIVLDGNVDPQQRTNQRLANKLERAGGFELALTGFLAECDKAGASCALAPDSRRKFDAVRERLRQGPADVPGLGTVTIDDLTGQVTSALYSLPSFPFTARYLKALYDGLFGPPAAARGSAVRPPSELPSARGWFGDAYSFNDKDAYFAVNCVDAPLPQNPALYPGIADRFEAVHRTFGRAEVFSEVGCANWPRVKERYDGPWKHNTANPVLVVNATYDPATPYRFAQRMTQELHTARLLTLDGFGHIAAGNSSPCITSWYARYLLTLELPPVGTHCAQVRPPFPST